MDREESKGDELRLGVRTILYSKALLPESRGEILRILEAADAVINRAESLLRQVVIERLEIEAWLRSEIRDLVTASTEACRAVHAAGGMLLAGNDGPLAELTHRVDRIESRCDHLEDDLLGRVFAADLPLSRKLQLKDFIRRLGTLSDLSYRAAETIHLAGLKRRI